MDVEDAVDELLPPLDEELVAFVACRRPIPQNLQNEHLNHVHDFVCTYFFHFAKTKKKQIK